MDTYHQGRDAGERLSEHARAFAFNTGPFIEGGIRFHLQRAYTCAFTNTPKTPNNHGRDRFRRSSER